MCQTAHTRTQASTAAALSLRRHAPSPTTPSVPRAPLWCSQSRPKDTDQAHAQVRTCVIRAPRGHIRTAATSSQRRQRPAHRWSAASIRTDWPFTCQRASVHAHDVPSPSGGVQCTCPRRVSTGSPSDLGSRTRSRLLPCSSTLRGWKLAHRSRVLASWAQPRHQCQTRHQHRRQHRRPRQWRQLALTC